MKLEVEGMPSIKVHLVFTIAIVIATVYSLVVGFIKKDAILLVCGVWSAVLSVICIVILGEVKGWW